MHRRDSTNSSLIILLKHLAFVSIAFSAIASAADVVGISLLNHELRDLTDALRLFVGLTLLTFLFYLIYLGIIRLIVSPLAGLSRFSNRLAFAIFYCLGLLPLDLLIARDLSVYFALGANPAFQVKFLTLRTDLLALVIVVSWIAGIVAGIAGTRPTRLPAAARSLLPARVLLFTALPFAIMLILYLPALLHAPSTAGTEPSNAPLTGRPANVILISIDTIRTDELGCYGSQGAKTPNIDRIAGESMVFDNAITPMPMTGPSHMSMMTGLQPDRVVGHGITSNDIPLPVEIPTLATILDSSGYQTGAVIGGLPLSRELSGLERGFHYYDDIFEDKINTVFFAGFLRSTTVFRVSQRAMRFAKIGFPYLKKPGNVVTNQAIGWLGNHATEPFFLFVHYFDTHSPLNPSAPFDRMYSPEDALRQQPAPHPFLFEDWKTHPPLDSATLAELRALYRGEVTIVDGEIGRLFDWGDERGLWDNTLLIITGDHGEGFDADYHGHINRLYESMVKVPMIIHHPRSMRQNGELRTDLLVNVSDIFFTVLSFLDVEPPESAFEAGARTPGSIDGWDHDLTEIGRSDVFPGENHFGWDFVAMLTHGAPGPDEADIGRLFALRFPDWKLIYGPDAQPYYKEFMCFDLAIDPGETVDVYSEWDWNREGHYLVPEALIEWASTQSRDGSDVRAEHLDPQVYESLRALGYVQ